MPPRVPDSVLVAGATGRSGREITASLVAHGIACTAFVRDTAKRELLPPSCSEVPLRLGSVEDEAACRLAVAGMQAVICAVGSNPADPASPPPSAIDRDGVARLAKAARQAGVRRFVLVSSLGATREEHPLNRYGKVLTMKLAGEDAVRRLFCTEAFSHTIIRPGGLLDTPKGAHELLAGTGDTISGKVSRGDLAEIAVRSLWQDAACNSTFELIEGVECQHYDHDQLFKLLGKNLSH